MPFVDLPRPGLGSPLDFPKGFSVTPEEDEINEGSDKPEPLSIGDAFQRDLGNIGAAFRTDSSIGAFLARQGVSDEPEPDFHSWEAIKGTKYEPQWESFVDVRSRRAADAMKRQLDMEMDDRKTLDALPWAQRFVLEGAASLADWPTLLPGGAFVKGVKGGFSILRSARNVGLAAAAASAAQEVTLHGLQELRTTGESAVNIGASAVLGGLIGGAGARLLTGAEWRAGVAQIDSLLRSQDQAATLTEHPIFLDVRTRLVATGMPESQAAANAAIVTARYGTRAARLRGAGGTAEDLYRAENIEIRRGEEGAEGRTDGLAADVTAARTFNQEDVTEAFQAWHGSPADFDRFSMDKIGTGEGAQSFGYGLYYAGNKKTGKSYREALAQHRNAVVRLAGDEIAAGRDPAAALRQVFPRITDTEIRAATEAATSKERSGRGVLYEVKIASDPERFVDLDRTVGEQKPAVRERLLAYMREVLLPEQEARYAAYESKYFGGVERLKRSPGHLNPDDFLKYPAMRLAPKTRAEAERMLAYDIPGLRYLDQGSRNKWFFKSSNYVVFDDRAVDIIRKYKQDNEGPQGRITLESNRATIELFARADESTFMHESSHLWLDELVRDASRAGAPAALRADMDTVLRWLGTDDASKIGVEQHEKWARGFEQYLATGKAPSTSLAAAFQKFADWLRAIYRNLTQLGEPISDDVRGVMDRLLATDVEIMGARGPGLPGSVGAAAVRAATLDENAIAGRAASTLAAATEWLNPALRLSQASSPVARDTFLNGFEFSGYLRKNFDGMASEQAAETLAKEWNAGLVMALKATNTVYGDYWKAGGRLSQTAFREAVGRAMRRGDEDPVPQVAAVAKAWRSQVFEPLKEAAIDVGLLPPDVSVKTAASYFSRQWNRNKLVGNEGDFKRRVTDFYAGAMRKDYEGASARHAALKARLEQEVADLEMQAAERGKLLEELPAELKRLREANPVSVALDEELAPLRSQAASAREAKNTAQAKALQGQITEKVERAGQTYADYVTKRNLLQTRISRIRNNIVGREDQVEKTRQSIAETEWRNADRLGRLHRSLTLLEQRMADASPEEWAADLAKARTDFAQTLDASTKAQERFAAARAKKGEEGKQAFEAGDVDKAKAIEAELKQPDPFVTEAKRQREMSEQADRISDIEKTDPEEAVRELRMLAERRLNQTTEIVENETKRMVAMVERLDKADPEKVRARVTDIGKRVADAERRFFDRWEIKALGERVGTDDADFTEAARMISDHVFATLTGKVETKGRPEFITITTRGPMKERTFNVPDELVEDFLDSDVEAVGRRYIRTMASDVELARKFGSPDMTEALQRVRDDYARLRVGAKTEKEALALSKEEERTIRDLEGIRDVFRNGSLSLHPVEQNYARILRGAGQLNYLRSGGEMGLAQLTDTIRPAMVHGLLPYMRLGLAALGGNLKAIKMSVRQAQMAGNVSEMTTGNRLAAITEITDPYSARSPVEGLLNNLTNVASKLNGIRLITDINKSIASVLTQNRILGGATRWAEISKKEKAYLAFLGIDQPMAERIAAQFGAHGETAGGVRVAYTEDWTDPIARRTYRAALNKDVDSIVVERGVADVPLFAHTPTGRAVLQFKAFALASHQRVLLRGLQESPARFTSGLVAMTAMGMFIVWAKALSGNRLDKLPDMAENPGWWIAEGLDRSGVLSVPMEVTNAFEKLTGFNVLKTPLKAFDEGSTLSQRNQNRNELGAFLGPTAGFAQDLLTVGGIPQHLKKQGDVSEAQRNAAERLIPFSSYIGARQMLRYVVNPPD